MMEIKHQSDDVKELVAALLAAQPDLDHAKKNSTNPHFRNDYANLESVIDTVRDAFTKNGLVVMQPTAIVNGVAVVVTKVLHKSGQFVNSVTPIINTKNDAQGMGSAITYARRYGLAAIANITQADDDGNTASAKAAPRKVDKTPPPASKAPPEEF